MVTDDYIEIEGPPDLIVEIVSKSSEKKDTLRLPAAYFAAGVPEFWLVDARHKPLYFQIHHRGDDLYVAAPGGGNTSSRFESWSCFVKTFVWSRRQPTPTADRLTRCMFPDK